jgi:hypothetical protein
MGTSPSVSFSELEAAATPPKPAESAAPPAATPEAPPAPPVPTFTEQDIQTLRTFSDAGITIQNYAQLLQAQQLINRLPDIIKTNPRILTAEIAKADPQAYDNLLEAISDEWYEVKGKKLEHQAQGNASSNAPSTDPRMENQLASLNAKLEGLIQDRNQEKSARQQNEIMAGYNSAMDGLLAKLPADVPETSKDYIRLKTQELVYRDQGARDRVAKGTYVDLPKYFAEASAKATADIKASAAKEHTSRAAVETRAGKEITPAAEAVNGTQTAPNEDSIWGDTGMMKDLQTALKGR